MNYPTSREDLDFQVLSSDGLRASDLRVHTQGQELVKARDFPIARIDFGRDEAR